MAILKVAKYGDKILRTPSKEIHKISAKIQKLAEDMLDTMYKQDGVGLAAPQVGENYRLFVIDAAAADEPLNPMVFINPKIIKKSGAANSFEGCLSFPDAYTNVRRYSEVIVRAKDLKGRIFTLEAKAGTLLCRAIQHENDHLDGILFIDHSRSRFTTDEELATKGLNPLEPDYLLEEEELEKEIQKLETVQMEEVKEI
ncbi:MAG: peptide deformylase [Candidatus Gastranaerophilales bacterium]|nr:peptide deformylase [Candidatus Gastranaerophilales bacterium]